MGKIKGLNKQEVAKRISEGKVNLSPKPVVKSNFQIIMGHVFNLFNAYNFIIAAALIAVQAYSSLFFVVIVISNTVIRARQEIKSKNMVAKLNLIVSPKTKVIREGKTISIDNEEIVLDDVVYFETGNQISADSIIIENNVEVDESLLTGEADPISKGPGDHLYPVGNPPPPRPRKLDSEISSITCAGVISKSTFSRARYPPAAMYS